MYGSGCRRTSYGDATTNVKEEMFKMSKFYIAYGSNLNMQQMSRRCQDAKFVGTGMIDNYELVFRGSRHSAVATVEPKSGSKVPVGIWEISDRDERSLDVYEGFPRLYVKKPMLISQDNVQHEAILYVMNDGYDYGMPNSRYYNTILQGYNDCHLDSRYLKESVECMYDIVEKMEIEEKYPLGYKDLRQ